MLLPLLTFIVGFTYKVFGKIHDKYERRVGVSTGRVCAQFRINLTKLGMQFPNSMSTGEGL